MKSYLYLGYLISMFLITYISIIYTKKYAPNKIKVIYMCLFSLIFIRNAVLFYTYLSNNLTNLYLAKGIIYFNLLCFPIAGIMSFYIFLRDNKFNFNRILGVIGILFISYIVNVYLNEANINLIDSLGYIFVSSNIKFIKIFTLVLYGSIMLISLRIFSGKASNKFGGTLIVISSITTIICNYLFYGNDAMIITTYLSEVLWVITLFYSLIRFKKSH